MQLASPCHGEQPESNCSLREKGRGDRVKVNFPFGGLASVRLKQGVSIDTGRGHIPPSLWRRKRTAIESDGYRIVAALRANTYRDREVKHDEAFVDDV